jgi:Flp pilus assembly protein TadD
MPAGQLDQVLRWRIDAKRVFDLKISQLAEFAAAAIAAPDNPRHAYVHAVALDGAGRRSEAMRVLKTVLQTRGDRDALLALASFALQSGDRAVAESAIRTLASINPDDPALGSVAGRP